MGVVLLCGIMKYHHGNSAMSSISRADNFLLPDKEGTEACPQGGMKEALRQALDTCHHPLVELLRADIIRHHVGCPQDWNVDDRHLDLRATDMDLLEVDEIISLLPLNIAVSLGPNENGSYATSSRKSKDAETRISATSFTQNRNPAKDRRLVQTDQSVDPIVDPIVALREAKNLLQRLAIPRLHDWTILFSRVRQDNFLK